MRDLALHSIGIVTSAFELWSCATLTKHRDNDVKPVQPYIVVMVGHELFAMIASRYVESTYEERVIGERDSRKQEVQQCCGLASLATMDGVEAQNQRRCGFRA